MNTSDDRDRPGAKALVPVKAGSKLINACFEPKSFAVEIDTDNGKEFATTKLTTRQTYTLAFVEGTLDPNPITFKELSASSEIERSAEQDGMDFAATTVKLPDGEYVPFLFTVKELVAKGEGSSFKPGFTWGGEFSVPSYRAWQRVQHAFLFQPFGGTARFFRAVKHTLRQEMGGNGRDQLREARGMNLGYDQVVGLPAMQADGKSGQDEIFKETNKVFDVGRGAIEMEVNKVNQERKVPELGEIGGVFVSKQPSDTDMGAKEPKTILLKGIFYGKVVSHSVVCNNPILHAGREQYSLLSNMLRRPELFVPMMGIWVASFGGALHGPVTTYFQVELGASTEQIGNFGVIRTIGVLLVSPLYGWLLDRHSAYTPAVLSAFCCTFGCLFHGFAQEHARGDRGIDVQHLYLASVVLALGAVNFWNVVGAYVALATPREQRHVVVTGFQVQVSVLRLLGTSLYPFVDSMLLALGVTQKLLRYRIHMSECSLFCVVAFVYLVGRFQPATWGEEVKTEAKASEETQRGAVGRPFRAAFLEPQLSWRVVEGEKLQTSQLALLLTTSVVQSFGETVVTVLWPLHLRKLHLGSHDLAWLQLSSQLLIILSTLGYPPLTRLLGHRFSASALPLLASLCSALAFLQPEPTCGAMDVALRSVESIAFALHSLIGLTEPCHGLGAHLTDGPSGALRRPTLFFPFAGLGLALVSLANFSDPLILAAQAYVVAFHSGGVFVHWCVNVLSFLALCGTMKVCYQHLATLAVPAAHQGRCSPGTERGGIFSLLNVLSSLGNIFGNLVATRLAEHDGGVLYSKGAAPFLVTSSLFCAMGCAVVGFLCVPHVGSEEHGKRVAVEPGAHQQ
eukprot:g17861.t1